MRFDRKVETVQSPYLRRRLRLGEFLIAKGVISEEQLKTALERQKQTGDFLGEALISLSYISPPTLGSYMEELTTFPYIELSSFPIDADLAHQISESYARQHMVFPFAEWDEGVQVAMVNPLDLTIVDDLRDRFKKRVVPFHAFKTDLMDAISRVYNAQHKGAIMLAELGPETNKDEQLSVDELTGLADDAPVVKLVNGIIEGAVLMKASDIHIEPQEKSIRVRYRQDGVLIEQMTFPRSHLSAVISRIKVMAQLNIAERRKPQDGRVRVKDDRGGEYDLRVSIMPLIHGETVVMRVLDKRMAGLKLETLGMDPHLLSSYNAQIRQPHGILLVTGPTGSGKTTTLYASLTSISTPDIKIVTVEDPVEYQLAGINQMQVQSKIGLSFAECLRSIVRQDPDVILVGEIRDKETAEIAIQAALTGHLVLSTLHTNDAPGALVRLQNMGIEPFLLSSSILGVLAQRLLRTVCTNCKTLVPATQEIINKFQLPLNNGQPPMLAHGTGCTRCNQKGMKGRMAVYEFMLMSDAIRALALDGAPSSLVRVKAIEEGMVTMKQDAIVKVLEGKTTLNEVTRVLFTGEDEGVEKETTTIKMAA